MVLQFFSLQKIAVPNKGDVKRAFVGTSGILSGRAVCRLGSRTNSLSAFAKPSHFLLLNAILRLTFSSQLTPPPSDQPSYAP